MDHDNVVVVVVVVVVLVGCSTYLPQRLIKKVVFIHTIVSIYYVGGSFKRDRRTTASSAICSRAAAELLFFS